MVASIEAAPRPAQHYRLPALLHDIRLFDLLELSGSTQEASRVSGVSQPTISRRTRLLAHDFALDANRRQLVGCRYGTNPALRLLRLGCRAHRLIAGVARLGADVVLQPLLAGCSWLLPAPPRFRPVESWLELVRQGVAGIPAVVAVALPLGVCRKTEPRGDFSPCVRQLVRRGIDGVTQTRCASLTLGIGRLRDDGSARRLSSLENGLFMPPPPRA